MYDIIGDIHGHAAELKSLLTRMDYKETNGVWQHPSRKAIFVGDLIDRGPAIREVLHIVRNMIDHNHALAVMGNHEYNAIAYAHDLGDRKYLRSHNETHSRQHRATLEQFSNYQDEWQDWLKWFYTLPLFLDLGELRVVHACWDHEHIEWLKQNTNGMLTPSLLVEAHDINSHAHTVIEETLKGKEINIPEECAWQDKDGHFRTSNRIKWWKHPREHTHDAVLFNCPVVLYNQPLPPDITFNVYPADAPPVFFGHYWLEDKMPAIQSHNVICLDYSVAKGGSLVGFRQGIGIREKGTGNCLPAGRQGNSGEFCVQL
jgi:hypothetical protein